jgi:hypothetical protein
MLNCAGGGSGDDGGVPLLMGLRGDNGWELIAARPARYDNRGQKKGQANPHPLIPAQAGIQFFQWLTAAE